ncbi:MAG TPA: hypothetical protein VKM72_25255 [Thermoanaerobaculia bacterium]|nr:hypothetical protein [Thermoanaerobaculia bacterium]
MLVTAAFLACQPKSPEEELLTKVEPVGSWIATLEMTGQKWTANSVPTSFVRNSTSAARKQLEKAAKEATKSPARPEVRLPLQRVIAEAEAASAGLRQAVEANDRPRLSRELGRLAGLRVRFAALRKAGEGSS